MFPAIVSLSMFLSKVISVFSEATEQTTYLNSINLIDVRRCS